MSNHVQESVDLSSLKEFLENQPNKPLSFWEKVAFFQEVIAHLLSEKKLPEPFIKNLFSLSEPHPLFFFYKAVIQELLHSSSSLSSDEYIILANSLLPNRRIEQEICLSIALLGSLKQDNDLLLFAKKIAEKELAIGTLPLLTKCQEYSSDKDSFLHLFLLYFVGSLLDDPKMVGNGQICKEGKLSNYYSQLLSWIENRKKIIGGLPFEPDLFYMNQEQGTAVLKDKSKALAISGKGMNTGLGSLKFNEISIPAFGPQFFPLSDAEGFGLYNTGRIPKDFAIQKNVEEFLFTLWSRLFDQGTFSKVWMGVQGNLTKEVLDLTLLLRGSSEKKMAFSFFVKADHCRVDGKKEIKLKSLDRYTGEAQTVTYSLKEESISFITPAKGPVHIIPLAGNGFFWDADFLIAFELSSPFRKLSLHLPIHTACGQ